MTLTSTESIVADGLTDAQCEAIEASMPKCPECGAGIALVHFEARQTHRFDHEIDGSCGEVLAYSTLHDTISSAEIYQAVRNARPITYGVSVECRNQHQWAEPRLKMEHKDSTGERWSILPEVAA